MKTFFRVSILGLLMFAVVAVSNQTTYAQDPKADLYQKFTDNYDGDLAQQKIAVKAGKEFIQKYENSADDKQIVDYLKSAVPEIEKSIREEEERLRLQEIADRKRLENKKRFDRFNVAFEAKNWAALFSSGSEILSAQPEFYDVAIVLATAGFDEAAKKNDSLNNETIKHAEYAISKLTSGAKPKSKTCAGNYYSYQTDDYPECVANAQGWMNYYIGWIKFYRQKEKDEAIPFFFKATKLKSGAGEQPVAYQAIGSWYMSKAGDIGKKRNGVLEERNAETKVEAPDEVKIGELDTKIDEMLALERGYAERAIDAYSRAYGLVEAKDRSSSYATGLFGTLQQLYKFRYEKPEMQSDTKINMNVSTIRTKAMPDPSTDVTPVMEVKEGDSAPASTKTDTGSSRSRTVSSNN